MITAVLTTIVTEMETFDHYNFGKSLIIAILAFYELLNTAIVTLDLMILEFVDHCNLATLDHHCNYVIC